LFQNTLTFQSSPHTPSLCYRYKLYTLYHSNKQATVSKIQISLVIFREYWSALPSRQCLFRNRSL